MWAPRDTQVHLKCRAHGGHTVKATIIHTLDNQQYQRLPASCLGSERHRSAISDSESGYKQTFTEKEVKGLPTEPLGTLSMHADKKGDGVGGREGREAGRMAGRKPEGISMQENLTQPVEHHRQAKMRVWGEVIRFDVSMVSLEVEC